MALASQRAQQLHAATQRNNFTPTEVSSAQLNKLLGRESAINEPIITNTPAAATPGQTITSPNLASGLKLANSAYELSASDSDEVIDLTAFDDDEEEDDVAEVQQPTTSHVLRLPFTHRPDIPRKPNIALDEYTVLFAEEETSSSDDDVVESKSNSHRSHSITDRKGLTVSPNTVHSSIKAILQSNTVKPTAEASYASCKHPPAATRTKPASDSEQTEAKASNLKRPLPKSDNVKNLSRAEAKQWGRAWDLPAFANTYRPPTINVSEQARFAAAAQKLDHGFASTSHAQKRPPEPNDSLDPSAKAERQRKMFEDAKKRQQQQQSRPAAPTTRSAPASANDVKFEIPAWFRDDTVKYSINECTAAVRYILSNQSNPYRCLCFAGESAVLKDKEGAARQLSKHYKRISQLVHPDRHQQILNELKQSPSKQTTSVSQAADAFKTLHAHYQTLKRVHAVQ